MSKKNTKNDVQFDSSNFNKFKKSKLVITRPTLNKSKGGFTWVTSDGGYLDEKGEVCNLIIIPPERFSFGFNEKYSPDIKDDQKTPENLKGYQVVYMLTDSDKVDNPTKADKGYIRILDLIQEKVFDVMEAEIESENSSDIPTATIGAFTMAKKNKAPAVKPMYAKPKPTEKNPNPPLRQYVDCTQYKNKKGIIIPTTYVYGPGNKPKSVLDYLSKGPENLVMGDLSACLTLGEKCVFWGSTGSKKEFGAGVTMEIIQCNFVPKAKFDPTAPPKKNYLAPNTAPIIESDDEDTDFVDPSGKSSGASSSSSSSKKSSSSSKNDDPFEGMSDDDEVSVKKLKTSSSKKNNTPEPDILDEVLSSSKSSKKDPSPEPSPEPKRKSKSEITPKKKSKNVVSDDEDDSPPPKSSKRKSKK